MYLTIISLPADLLSKNLQAQEGRPNFIFIYTDDQRYDCLEVVQKEQGDKARFPWLKTPNLDKLSKEGIRFKNAFVVQSLCTPEAKLITYPEQGWVELFDLKNDPYERRNLAEKEGYSTLKQELLEMLEQEKVRTQFKLPDNYRPVPDDDLEDWRKGAKH